MDISNYLHYFHDGTVINIKHKKNDIQFLIESFPINQDDLSNKDFPPLSENHTLKGILHIDGIKYIKIENKPFHGILRKEYDDGEILDIRINKNTIVFLVEWKNLFPKKRTAVTNEIEIKSDAIYWENII
jgi:antitoxin component YwqK of YwqJK toxin-antitoxin module